MTVLGRLEVDGVSKVKLFDYNTGPQIEVVLDNLHELIRILLRCTVCLDKEREGLGNTNSV
jgi:hypothetical protein